MLSASTRRSSDNNSSANQSTGTLDPSINNTSARSIPRGGAANAPPSNSTNVPDTIIFNVGKGETLSPNSNGKEILKKLKSKFKVATLKEEITIQRLAEARVLIIGGPKAKFSVNEFAALQSYLDRGGNIVYMADEGGEGSSGTNFNYLLEEHGISVNNDAVVRTAYCKYLHPKEVLVNGGVLNREINRAGGKRIGANASAVGGGAVSISSGPGKINSNYITFLYPFGATLSVEKPAIPLLSSGPMSYPLNRPIGAVYPHPNGKGKLLVFGSTSFFSDSYIEKEENSLLFDVFVTYLTGIPVPKEGGATTSFSLNPIDANEPEVTDYHYLPDVTSLSDGVRSCILESDDVPRDFTTLFDSNMFKFDTNHVPAALKTYSHLSLKAEPLSLIQPQFETPLPTLSLTSFAPTLVEVAPPPLELFDLDDCFAGPEVRLAQLTNRCTDADLEYYIKESSRILGIALPGSANAGAESPTTSPSRRESISPSRRESTVRRESSIGRRESAAQGSSVRRESSIYRGAGSPGRRESTASGVPSPAMDPATEAKAILAHVFKQIVGWKKL